MAAIVVFFFFSSRRRHTRSLRDWSSDVCSSDLPAAGLLGSYARRRSLCRRGQCRQRSGLGGRRAGWALPRLLAELLVWGVVCHGQDAADVIGAAAAAASNRRPL